MRDARFCKGRLFFPYLAYSFPIPGMQSVEKGSGLGLPIWNFPGFSGEGRDLFGINGERDF